MRKELGRGGQSRVGKTEGRERREVMVRDDLGRLQGSGRGRQAQQEITHRRRCVCVSLFYVVCVCVCVCFSVCFSLLST